MDLLRTSLIIINTSMVGTSNDKIAILLFNDGDLIRREFAEHQIGDWKLS